MPVLDWFWFFVDRHIERIPLSTWPALDSLYWTDVWLAGAVKHGVVEGVADEASRSLAQSPPKFLDDQYPAFIESVKTVWAMSEVVDGSLNYAAIQLQNRGCNFCCGMGMVSRRVEKQSGAVGGITLYCVCPAGRWLKIEHAKNDGDADKTTKGRILDLADYPKLKEPEIEGPIIRSTQDMKPSALARIFGSTQARAAPASRPKPAWATGKPEPNYPVAPPKREPEPEGEPRSGTPF